VAVALNATAAAGKCDVTTEGSICLGKDIILPRATAPGVIGYWAFDESLPVDSSGLDHHGDGTFDAGPSVHGSSLIGGTASKSLAVAPTAEFDTPDFSYTLWVMLKQPPADAAVAGECNVLRKGDASAHSPKVSISADHHIDVSLTTTSGPEAFTSMSKLRYGLWYHVTVARLGAARQTRLYVNGILDTQKGTDGYTQANALPLVIGGDDGSTCGFGLYIDEVKAYNRVLYPDYIGAEAASALGGTEAAYVRFGCSNCNLDQAMASCPDQYHICTSLELHTEAYRIARTLGWIASGVHVWTHATDSNAAAQAQGGVGPGSEMITETAGLGICCMDV